MSHLKLMIKCFPQLYCLHFNSVWDCTLYRHSKTDPWSAGDFYLFFSPHCYQNALVFNYNWEFWCFILYFCYKLNIKLTVYSHIPVSFSCYMEDHFSSNFKTKLTPLRQMYFVNFGSQLSLTWLLYEIFIGVYQCNFFLSAYTLPLLYYWQKLSFINSTYSRIDAILCSTTGQQPGLKSSWENNPTQCGVNSASYACSDLAAWILNSDSGPPYITVKAQAGFRLSRCLCSCMRSFVSDILQNQKSSSSRLYCIIWTFGIFYKCMQLLFTLFYN